MATRLSIARLPPNLTMSSTSSKRPTNAAQRSRPRKHADNPTKPQRRPTHFLALPIGHHAELRSAVSALTSSWLAHEPPIDGLDPSIVVHPRRLHLTLGVMALAPSQPTRHHHHRDRESEPELDLPGATTLLASLAPRIRAVLAHSPLRVPLGRLAVMQPDPARAHVLYVEPDLRSPDGRLLRAVCGACFFSFSFLFFRAASFLIFLPLSPPPGSRAEMAIRIQNSFMVRSRKPASSPTRIASSRYAAGPSIIPHHTSWLMRRSVLRGPGTVVTLYASQHDIPSRARGTAPCRRAHPLFFRGVPAGFGWQLEPWHMDRG